MENTLNPKRGKMSPEQLRQKPFDRMRAHEELNRIPGKEDTKKRTGSSKIFALGHGQYQAVLYPEQVHAKDQEGNWVEIDNTLESREDAQGMFLCNKQNPEFKATLRSAGQPETVRLENEKGQWIAWAVENAQNVQPVPVPCSCPEHKADDVHRRVLDHLDSEAEYPGILPGVNLRCRVKSTSFKDEWIMATAAAAQPVVLRLLMPDMIPQEQENGEIQIIASDGEIPFILPCPFLKDSSGNGMTGEVTVRMEPCTAAPDMWRVTYIPDAQWVENATFPVTMDPVVITKKHSSAIEDNFITSVSPYSVQSYNNEVMRVTQGSSTWGTSKTFLRFLDSELPKIDSSYYVTKAFFHVETAANGYGINVNPTSSASLYLREVLGAWSASTITYNNAPAVSDKPLDYVYVSSAQSWLSFDISNLVRKWYSGTNYGICLDVDTNTWINLYSSDYAYAKPYVQINYVSLAGLEDYLAYEEQNMGRAGTGYVSLYNGNLIFAHQDTTSNGNLMPVSVAHYYNSCYYDVDPFNISPGWKLNVQQYLHRETLLNENNVNETYYVYTDEDGTRHHFRQTAGKWKDLSGLGLELTISGSTATIRSKGDTAMLFDLPTVEFADNYANVKMLKSITDSCGNTVTIHSGYSNNFIYAIDGAGRYTELISSLRPESVKGPGENNFASMDYDGNGHISGFYHPDGARTYYTYNSLGLLESVTDVDGRKVTYTYTTSRANGPYRVSRVELSNGNVKYGGRRYIYGDCMTTVIDLVPNAAGTVLTEGKSIIYHFNDYGNVVSVNDQLGYAAFAKYADSLPVNHPENISRMQRSVVNLLRNHSFESTDGWTLNNMSRATDSCYIGKYALKVSTNGTTTGNHYAMQTVTLVPGKTYTLSFYARKSGNIDIWSCFAYWNASGTLQYAHQPSLKSQVTTEYSRLSQTFTLPADASSNQVNVFLFAGAGVGEYFTGWFDCVQLEEGPVANSYNMLINGDFTFESNAKPTGWQENSTNESRDRVYPSCTGTKPEGLSANTMRLYGTGRTKYGGIYQDIPVSGSQGDVFSAGGWSFNYSMPRKGENFRYDIRVAFLKSGTSSTRESAPSIEWSEEWTDWQFAAGPVVAPCNYTAIRFNVDYERNINYSEFGGLFLYKEEFGKTFGYDANGNVLSTTNLASMQSNATYDDYNNLLTYRQYGRPSTVKYTLDWGSTEAEKKKHLMLSTTSPLGIISANTYDNKGNPLTNQVKNSTGSLVIETHTTYTDNQNYVKTKTDARGKVVTSDIDLKSGLLTSVTDPNGQKVSYTYDTMKRVVGTESTADGKTYRNAYTYNQDKLAQVAHNTTSDSACDVQYNFAYDGAGRPTTVKTGSQTLCTNVYNPDGTLQKVVYGNSTGSEPQEVRYTYDDYKRLIGTQYDFHTSDVYQYVYGANGQVVQMKDNFLGRVVTSEHDTANRPMRITHMQGTTHLYTGEVEYDAYNNLKTFKEKVGGSRTAYQTDFTYDNENKPTQMTFGDVYNKVNYVYDAIGRTSSRTVTVGGRAYATTYGYLPGSNGGGNTTGLISSIIQSGENFTYTYDNVGNIASVTQNGVTTSYAYDKLGQLIRANDPNDPTSGSAGTTWTYEYDRGGNILNKKRYAYTTGTVGTLLQTIPYSYTDSNWKDKLTAYNGQTISYDSIGNPLSDGEWKYQWEKGRQLRQMYKGTDGQAGSVFVNFLYNADGLRVSKQVLTYTSASTTSYVSTDYTWHGKKIVHMTQSGNNLHFWYYASGRPAMVEFNGTKYAYIVNLQGDVVGLLDSTGTEVVKYTYDAWGKPISTTGSLASSLGTVQPFRYRGYVYDEETELYYLRSRYYNPEWNRFVNADNKLSNNLYMYCNNRPSMEIDDSGNTGREIMEACNGILAGTHSLDNEMLSATTFVEMLEYMVEEQWMYPDIDEDGNRYPTSWGIGDCYGIYVACMKAYYTPEDFEKLATGTTCYWAEKNATYRRCIRKQDKLIRPEVKKLQIGMAVLITHRDNGSRYYDHIAYVAGFNDDGTVDLIESNVDEHNNVMAVHHTTLNDKYVWAIRLAGIAY